LTSPWIIRPEVGEVTRGWGPLPRLRVVHPGLPTESGGGDGNESERFSVGCGWTANAVGHAVGRHSGPGCPISIAGGQMRISREKRWVARALGRRHTHHAGLSCFPGSETGDCFKNGDPLGSASSGFRNSTHLLSRILQFLCNRCHNQGIECPSAASRSGPVSCTPGVPAR